MTTATLTTTTAADAAVQNRSIKGAVRAVLIVFPVLYLLHGFFPHIEELFGQNNRAAWAQFWGTVAVLHWSSVAIALWTLRRHRLDASTIGLDVSGRQLAAVLGGLVAFGLLLVLAHATLGRVTWFGDSVPVFHNAGPATYAERLGWVFVAVTAGFCEEVVYRGFAIGGLRAGGVSLRRALVWSTVAFVFLHGFSAFFLFPLYITVGLAFAFLYLKTGSLVPGIVAHSVLDLLVILAS